MPDTFTNAHRVEITPLVARYRLPAAYPFHFFAEIGELMSYGNDQADNFRRAGDLRRSYPQGCEAKGASGPGQIRAGDHLKTAKALGLTVPPTLLTR